MLTTNFRMRVLSSSVSLFAVVAALAAATGVSHAQTAATPAATGGAETITVTGYRSSLEKALDLKRKSDNSIDAIYAEDIAKFPELNLGDAIARVPGVSLQKEGGEGRNISVRGLGPNFTRILVNGMEAQATNTSPDNIGGVDRNRQFDFNTFAPDLFNQIIVAKTQSASTEEGLARRHRLPQHGPRPRRSGPALRGKLQRGLQRPSEDLQSARLVHLLRQLLGRQKSALSSPAR